MLTRDFSADLEPELHGRGKRRPRFNPLHPEVLANPYPVYRGMRHEAPVLFDRRFGWLVFRYEDVAAGLKDSRLSALRPQPADPVPRILQPIANEVRVVRALQDRWLLCADPPRHTRLRALVGATFSPRLIDRLRPRVQSLVDELLDRAAAAGGFDAIADFAYPLPTTIIAELLGVPTEDLDKFKLWSDAIAGSFTWAPETMRAAHGALVELTAYFGKLAVEHERRGRDDTLLEGLLQAQVDGSVVSRDELLAQCVMLLFAGHETTTNLIGNGVLALLRHPGELARLRANPRLIESALEELLRFDSPTQATFRSVAEDFQWGSQRLRRGDNVLLMLGSANRDPAVFTDPDRLDLARRDNRHLAFSQGPHYCLGAALARLEGQIAIGTLVRRFGELRLEDVNVKWRPNVFLRGLEALPIGL